jgi:hypothetical protein
MQLLFKRSQQSASFFSLIPLRIGSGVIFSLFATLQLNEEEKALLHKYNLSKVPLVVSDPIEDMKQSFRPALLLGFVGFFVVWLLIGFSVAIITGFLITTGMTALYWRELREQINISDLLDGGKRFRCDSVVELIKKEAYLEGVCEYLCQLLESAKHWDDREVIDIKPLDKRVAKLVVLKAAG